MPVEEQVAVIYAVTNGFLDNVEVTRVRAWERGFLEYMRAQSPQVLDTIRTSKAISKDVEADLRRAIEAYSKNH